MTEFPDYNPEQQGYDPVAEAEMLLARTSAAKKILQEAAEIDSLERRISPTDGYREFSALLGRLTPLDAEKVSMEGINLDTGEIMYKTDRGHLDATKAPVEVPTEPLGKGHLQEGMIYSFNGMFVPGSNFKKREVSKILELKRDNGDTDLYFVAEKTVQQMRVRNGRLLGTYKDLNPEELEELNARLRFAKEVLDPEKEKAKEKHETGRLLNLLKEKYASEAGEPVMTTGEDPATGDYTLKAGQETGYEPNALRTPFSMMHLNRQRDSVLYTRIDKGGLSPEELENHEYARIIAKVEPNDPIGGTHVYKIYSDRVVYHRATPEGPRYERKLDHNEISKLRFDADLLGKLTPEAKPPEAA